MKKKPKEYRKLTGIRKGFIIGRYTLWQGGDHLLQIFSRFGIEDYKRYYFNDIQAIIVSKTDTGKVYGLVLGLLGGLFGLVTLTSEGGWSVFSGIILAVLLVFFLVNWLKGPTCKTQIYTPVQTEELPSLHRLRFALKVMDRLRPVIEKTQGALKPENLPENLPPGPAPRRPPAAPAAAVALRAPSPGPVVNRAGRVHFMLFILLLLYGLFNLTELAITHIALSVLGSVIMMSMFIFIIIALIRQQGSNMGGALCGVTWVAAGFGGVSLVGSYILTMVNTFKNPQSMQNQWEIFKTMSSISPWDSSFLLGFNFFSWLGALILGGAGVALLNKHRRKKRYPAAAPATSPDR